jgi:hypothetical protein
MLGRCCGLSVWSFAAPVVAGKFAARVGDLEAAIAAHSSVESATGGSSSVPVNRNTADCAKL